MNLEQSHKILKKLPTPWTIFFLIFTFFYLLPSTLLYLNFEKNLLIPDPVYQIAISFLIQPETLDYFLYSPLLFFTGYLIPIIILLILSLSSKQKSSKELLARNLEFQNPLFIQSKNFILLAGLIGAVISIFYFFFIALSMLSNLGEEISNEEFRFLLFDDRYRYFNLLLEIARRILLPIAVSFLMFQSLIFKGRLSNTAKLFWIILFFSGVITLDRGPVMIAMALMIVYLFLASNSYKHMILYLSVSFTLVLVLGGLVTYLQYNETDFSFIDIIMQGFAVIINRLFYDPALMALVNSFSEIDGLNEPLKLRFSRIGVLWGQEYVGTMNDNSIYVTPVGIIGDIWRNFGFLPMIFFGSLISSIFIIITYYANRSIILFRLPIAFLTIIWSFYVIVGSLFSIGVLGILSIILFISTISQAWPKPRQ